MIRQLPVANREGHSETLSTVLKEVRHDTRQ